MPGPVSDSYDPEFGTAAKAESVRKGLREVLSLLEDVPGFLTSDLHYIVTVARDPNGPTRSLYLSERQARLIRFSLLRSLESV